MTFNIKNDIKQLEIKNDLLTNQLERNRNEQNTLSKEENKIKRIIVEKKELLYNLVRIHCGRVTCCNVIRTVFYFNFIFIRTFNWKEYV